MTADTPLLLHYPDSTSPPGWSTLPPVDWSRPTAITIGTLGKPDSGRTSLPDLTNPPLRVLHLRCYALSALTSLPNLPQSLASLDLQGLAMLTELPALPEGLQRLTLIGLHALKDFPYIPRMDQLRALTLRDLPDLPESVIQRLLQNAPNLTVLRLQTCGSLQELIRWPERLAEIRLEDTPVTHLPDAWPAAKLLHTLSLRGCHQLTNENLPRAESFPLSVRILDLAGCRALTKLPFPEDRQPFPHTLHLSGSGLLRPLKSQHGADSRANVAAETQRYFAALRLLDTRSAPRCKILIMGNGRAGKTFLTQALLGKKVTAKDDAVPEEQRPVHLRSTHGVQFYHWADFKPKRREEEGEISSHVNLWDFGGQELYHNTHQLFVRSGCLFLLVWNPDQDGRAAPALQNGFQDVWRPLAYWFHLIRNASEFGDTAKILLVHAHRPHHTTQYKRSELEEAARKQAGDLAGRLKFFQVNSVDDGNPDLELESLRDELRTQTGEVINAQGTAVPAHWDLALQMVERWDGNPKYQQLTVDQFRDELHQEIERTLRGQRKNYPKLQKAWKRTFRLDHEAVRDTLRFLTHSGWAFWHEERMPNIVIIGQKWAMEGIYAFTRREGPLSDYLEQSGGLIRFSQMKYLEWGSPHTGERYTQEEHRILFNYAESCGVIFPLKNLDERWNWGESVYGVFDRLPKQGAPDWELAATAATELGQNLPLTRAPWNRFLEACGQTFGTHGQYAQSAFRVDLENGESLHVTFNLQANGINADVKVRATQAELAQQVFRQITQNDHEDRQRLGTYKAKNARSVFVSYAWATPRPDFDPPETLNLDTVGPVDAITAHFDQIPGLRLIRDTRSMKYGDYIPDFIGDGIKADRILCVFSERYFYRPWCLLELGEIMKRVNDDPNQFFQVVTPVLICGVKFDAETTDRRKDFWSEEKNIKTAKCPKIWNLSRWRDVRTRFDRTIDLIGQWMGQANLYKAVIWDSNDKDRSLASIQQHVS